MFDNNEVYNLLAAGHSPEDIAAAFSKSLNDAEAQLNTEREELRAREAEAKLRHQAQDAKRKTFANVVSQFFSAIGEHYPEFELDDDSMTEDVCMALADLIIMAIDLESIKMKAELKPQPQPKHVKVELKKPSHDEIFADFFKHFGLS